MKKIFYISAVLIWVMASCDVLDVKPYHSIVADDAITNPEQVEAAIIGTYDAVQSDGYYGLNYHVFGDLTADNTNHIGITVTWADFDNNIILADNGLVESTWAAIYRVINRANNTLSRIPDISDEIFPLEEKNRATAELLFLRALAHYDLMRLWGPVPIRDMPVSADEESLNLPRSSVDQVLLLVNSDLEFAMEYLPNTITRGRASKPAAHALKARVALHQYYITQNTQFLQQAIDHATLVIDHEELEIEPDFATLFQNTPNSESVFEVAYNEQDRNIIARYYAHTALAGRYEFVPTETYLDGFADGDVRLNISVDSVGSEPYAVKYNDIASGTDPVYVLRLAEMYLIRAEANILLEEEPDIILDDINVIRERAGLIPATTTSYTALRLEVESQRQKEFAFEGHRWFDLVRTGRAIDVLPNVNNVNQTLFPIPQAEIITNDNPGMYQNEGY